MRPKLSMVLASILSRLWVFLGGYRAYGQVSQGELARRVSDSSGTAISGAIVTATEKQTWATTNAITNSEGCYLISSVPVGTYTVKATQPGFQVEERTPVVVATAVSTTVDFELKPGAVTPVVKVQGAAPLLQTKDAQVSTVIQNPVVMELPLQMSSSGTDASGRRQKDNFIRRRSGAV